jgi:parallel beta-helix repeat protein
MINNSRIHDNVNYGIQLFGASNNYINNSQIYNNKDGIYMAGKNGAWISTGASSNNNIINNSMIFNNNSYGIYLIAGE